MTGDDDQLAQGTRHPHGAAHYHRCFSTECPCYREGYVAGGEAAAKELMQHLWAYHNEVVELYYAIQENEP